MTRTINTPVRVAIDAETLRALLKGETATVEGMFGHTPPIELCLEDIGFQHIYQMVVDAEEVTERRDQERAKRLQAAADKRDDDEFHRTGKRPHRRRRDLLR